MNSKIIIFIFVWHGLFEKFLNQISKLVAELSTLKGEEVLKLWFKWYCKEENQLMTGVLLRGLAYKSMHRARRYRCIKLRLASLVSWDWLILETFWGQILNLRIKLGKVTTNFYDPTEKSIVITKKTLFTRFEEFFGNGLC